MEGGFVNILTISTIYVTSKMYVESKLKELESKLLELSHDNLVKVKKTILNDTSEMGDIDIISKVLEKAEEEDDSERKLLSKLKQKTKDVYGTGKNVNLYLKYVDTLKEST